MSKTSSPPLPSAVVDQTTPADHIDPLPHDPCSIHPEARNPARSQGPLWVEVEIVAPDHGAIIEIGDQTELEAQVIDAHGNDLGARLRWHSSLDGPLGAGTPLHCNLGGGNHRITAAASSGTSVAEAEISVTVVARTTDPTCWADEDVSSSD